MISSEKQLNSIQNLFPELKFSEVCGLSIPKIEAIAPEFKLAVGCVDPVKKLYSINYTTLHHPEMEDKFNEQKCSEGDVYIILSQISQFHKDTNTLPTKQPQVFHTIKDVLNSGYYWVKTKEVPDEWMPAEFIEDGEFWIVLGYGWEHRSKDISEVGSKLEAPK